MPLAESAKNILGAWTDVLNDHQMNRINCHRADCNEDSVPESNSNTDNWLNWNGDCDNPTVSKDNWEVHNESAVELGNGTEDPEYA